MASESETKQDGDFNPDSFSRVRVAGGERQGGKQYQEDSHFHWTSPRGAVVVASIFDGHGGLNGAVASQTARQVALDYLVARQTECETWDDDTWGRRLEELFEVIHESIRKQLVEKRDTLSGSMSSGPRSIDEKGIVRFPSGEPVHGGSTGTMVVLRRFRGSGDSQPSFSIISANVGDSTAIMLPEKGKFSFLTVDHGPENKEEFLRIQKLDPKQHPEKLMFVYDKTSVFRKYDCPKVFLDDGNKDPVFVTNPWGNGLHPTNVRYEPAVYAVTPRTVSRDTTCIAMTRALGDFYAHQFGLTYHPSIVVTHPPPGMRFILAVASDGIWDCWRYEDLLEYINARYAPDKSLESLNETTLNESIQRAITNFGSKHYDDASMILVECTPLNSE